MIIIVLSSAANCCNCSIKSLIASTSSPLSGSSSIATCGTTHQTTDITTVDRVLADGFKDFA